MKSYELDPTGDRERDLHAAFLRAAQAIENSANVRDDSVAGSRGDDEVADVQALRAMVRGAATAYAQRLRDEGVTPERMLILVKATTDVSRAGLGVRELTNDIVRWSIEAYFAD